MGAVERRVLLATCTGHSLCHVYESIFGAVAVLMAVNLGVSFKEVSNVAAAGFFLLGIGALPVGLLVTRTNARLVLLLFFLFSGIAAALTGLVPDIRWLAIALGFLGLAIALYHVAGFTLISQGLKTHGRAMGIVGVAGSAGLTLAPIICMPLADRFGWRAAYLVLAVPGLIAFGIFLFDRRLPREHPPAHTPPPAALTGSSRLGIFILALVIMGINGFIYRGFMTTFPSYIRELFPQAAATEGFLRYFKQGALVTAVLSAGMLGQYAGGLLADRMRKSLLYMILFAIEIPLLVCMGNLAGAPLIAASVLFTLVHFGAQPVENALVAAITPPRLVGSAYGVKFTLTFGLGAFGAAFAGFVAGDTVNYAAVFPALAFVQAAALVLAGWLAWRDRPRAASVSGGKGDAAV